MKRNLGNFERIARLALGLVALAVAATRGSYGVSEAVITILGVFLVLNGLLGRCYLWKALGITTVRPNASCGLAEGADRATD